MLSQNRLAIRLDLAEGDRAKAACPFETERETADSAEQVENIQHHSAALTRLDLAKRHQ